MQPSRRGPLTKYLEATSGGKRPNVCLPPHCGTNRKNHRALSEFVPVMPFQVCGNGPSPSHQTALPDPSSIDEPVVQFWRRLNGRVRARWGHMRGKHASRSPVFTNKCGITTSPGQLKPTKDCADSTVIVSQPCGKITAFSEVPPAQRVAASPCDRAEALRRGSATGGPSAAQVFAR